MNTTKRLRLVVTGTILLFATCVSAVAGSDRTRPHCTKIRFSGAAVGGYPMNLSAVDRTRDLEDLLARNPLKCGPNALSQTYACSGITFFADQPGYVVDWGEDWLQVVTPVLLEEEGRQNTMLSIKRARFTCVDKKPPSTKLGENLIAFFRAGSSYK